MFIGREKELSELERLYEKGTFQLFILYGRRRVGKTTLLKEFCRNKNSIFFSAEQSNEKMNLDKFSGLVFEHFGESALEPFSSLENALLYIHEKTKEEPLVLVFDEFPYLAAVNPALLSTLQHLIDHRLQQGKLFLVLCGSYMGFMEKEVLGSKSPLFGRRTAQLHMRPFDYRTSCELLEGFSDEEKLMLYGAYGGTPLYLRQVDPCLSLKENIENSFLRPTAYLYEEPLLLLRQEVQEPGVYSAIIEAIAGGASRANEIATKTGEPAAKCLKYIASLCELGIIDRQTPFGKKASSQKSIYRISDFMFRFWYRYVSGNKTLLETDAMELVWKRKIEPDYSHYMGLVFEQACREYLLRKNSLGELPLLFTEIGSWWGTDRNSPEHAQAEVDLVARGEADYLFCECKWRNQPLDYTVLEKLRHRADLVSKQREKTWFALFSKTGFTDAVLREAEKDESVLLFGLKDMMA
ncbi:MAG: ATP-binding protein [Lachnospiraceae bacterium]|nr:ATP-binding protein [Lachnospiraceae bacterium]